MESGACGRCRMGVGGVAGADEMDSHPAFDAVGIPGLLRPDAHLVGAGLEARAATAIHPVAMADAGTGELVRGSAGKRTRPDSDAAALVAGGGARTPRPSQRFASAAQRNAGRGPQFLDPA